MKTTSQTSAGASKRVLEPGERIAEVLFGLIMVLTFTGSLSVAEASRGAVRTMLIGALGCNVAWGIIDAVLYLMGCLGEQARNLRTLRAVQESPPGEARGIIAGGLPPAVAAVLDPADYDALHRKLQQLPPPPARPSLGRSEWKGALAVFLWVFLTTFPVAFPFLFMDDASRALRVSNAIAIGLLFVTGYAFGRISSYWPWLTGLAMVVLGSALVAITMALGG